MSIFDFFKRNKSANLAKERLRMVLSYERKDLPTNFTEMLQKDLIQVFEKYPQFNLSNIEINVNTGNNRDELSISIPFVNSGNG
jgi:cell division topological specificity factor